MHSCHLVGQTKLSANGCLALMLAAACLLAGCSQRQEGFAQKLREHRDRLQEVLAVDSEADALGKDAGSFRDFLEQVRDDPDSWPATLVLDSEPAISGGDLTFSFRYRKGMKIKVGGPEDPTFFDPGQPGVVTLAVDRGGNHFAPLDLTIPEEIKDLGGFEKWLATLPSLTPEQLAKFKFLLLAGTSRVIIESTPEKGTEPTGHAPANASTPADEGPWAMEVPAQKMEARRADSVEPVRVWRIAMISRVIDVVVRFPHSSPVIKKATLREEEK